MIQLLYSVLFAEGGLILLLLVKTPLRKLAIMGLDRVKRGRGPVMVKTIAGTVFAVLSSSVYSMVKIQKRSFDAGMVTPTDQVLMGRHLLEASLMGTLQFLLFCIVFFFFFLVVSVYRGFGLNWVCVESLGYGEFGFCDLGWWFCVEIWGWGV